MSYLRRDSRPRPMRQIFMRSIGVLLLLVVVFFAKPVLIAGYERIAFVRKVSDTVLLYVESVFSSKYQLEKRIEVLEQDAIMLRSKIALLQGYEQTVSHIISTSTPLSSYAAVISRPPFTPYDSLLINKGSSDGLEVGSKIYTSATNVLIGRVEKTMSHSSHVTLLSNSDSKIEVQIGTSTEAFEAVGIGNGAFEVKVPKAVTISVGESVRLPEDSLGVYAYIEEIDVAAADPFFIARFRLPISWNNLELVIIKKK